MKSRKIKSTEQLAKFIRDIDVSTPDIGIYGKSQYIARAIMDVVDEAFVSALVPTGDTQGLDGERSKVHDALIEAVRSCLVDAKKAAK